MHFGDSIFIFLLALVLFGPKKLPEIGRTIGKLLAEFRRASNEFKFQIQEELRTMEDDERRKKLAEMQAQKAADAPPATTAALPEPGSETPDVTPSILPPSTGTPVSTA
ncbi:MAG: twin-arginine translocase TatA/TatE family subunit, partial [Acidobacteriaceae bacterium]